MSEALKSSAADEMSRQLDRNAPEPLHDQISLLMRQRIVSGRWPPHMRLPSEPDLAEMLQVARGTIRRAIRTLIDDRLLIQHQGRGTFVESPLLEQSFAQEIISTAEALDRAGVRYETTVIRQGLAAAAENVAGHLRLPDAHAEVVSLRRIRSIDNLPVYVLDNYVTAARCPGLESADLTSRPLFTVLEQEHGLVVDGVQRTFQAQIATHAIATLLHVSVGSPVLYLEQISYDVDANPIEYSDVWIRGDKLRLSAWLHR
ncbi:MAG: GntR family transcriptional regulator [Ilumatobacteraceae bacterium]